MLCCPRSVSLCRMQFPGARYVPWLRRGLGAERPSWIRGHGRDLGAEGLRAPNPVSPPRSTHGQCDSGAGNPQQSSWAQGSRGSPAPHRPMKSAGPGGENGLHCFPEPRRVGGVVCCPRRVSLCRMQLPEARHGLSLRRGLGGERLNWLRGHGWGLGAEGLHAPNPTSQRRRTSGEWVSGTGDPQQSSRAQGARGSPAQLRPMESGGPGAKTACVDFLRRGKLRLWWAAQGEFPFAECSSQKLVLICHCDGASALSGRAGSGGTAAA